MNILKIAFAILNLPTLWASTFNVSLKSWRLHGFNPNKTIDEAIKEYFEKKTYLLSVAIHLEYSLYWELFINDYLTDVLKSTETMTFEIFVNHDGHERKKKVLYHNLWYIDSYKAFSALLPAISNDFVESMGQYMVIMNTARNLRPEQELQLIFESAFQRNIVDIAVAIYAGKFAFNLYTYDIFLPQQCRQAKTRKFNSFRNGSFASDELFPRKLQNFHKCPIDIFIRTAAPFFYYNLTKDRTQIDYYGGLEAKIVQAMADFLNFDIRFRYWGESEIGHVHENGTTIGPFSLLKDHEIDILLGYYHNPTRYHYFSVSTSYFLTPLVVIVRRHDEGFLRGMWFMEPYHESMWLMIFLTLVLGMTLVTLLHNTLLRRGHLTVHLTWLDMFGLALCNARTYEFSHFCTQYGFIMWTLGFMIICASYEGKLYGAFHRQPISSPLTISELVRANYTFFLKRFVSDELITALQIPADQIVFNDYLDDDSVFEAMLTDSRKMAQLTNYWQFQAFVGMRQLYDAYNIVPRMVVMNQVCAYMRPQSYLIGPFNDLLNAFNSVGVFKKWMLDAAVHFKITDGIGITSQRDNNSEPQSLSMDKVQVVFIGLAILHVVALLVFLGEIFAKKISNKMK